MLQEVAGGRSLYRSMEEMAPQRRLKGLTTRMWFRPTRGGTKVSQVMDHPACTTPGEKKGIIGNKGK